jgi:glyoxylase-like metal-dependent hydrolase (beta-lactamase superfamily II)
VTSRDVRLTVLDTGHCTTRAALIATGTGWHEERCHATAFLIRHPEHGIILFDTGYAPRLLDAFEHWPDRLYSFATPTVVGTPVVEHLRNEGIAPEDVSAIIVSHLHADHVAGLRDFAAARFVVSRPALALQRTVHGIGAVRRGVIQALFPHDFADRAVVISAFDDETLPALGATHDLFGDGVIRLLSLPGHARGQLGALVQADGGEVLLCADGAWSTRAFMELRPPHWITSALQDDVAALQATLRALREFAAARPRVAILPTHCPRTLHWGGIS